MQNDHDTVPPGPEDPLDLAREAIEAMRAKGPVTPGIEAAILAAGRGHARILAQNVELEKPK